MCAKGVPGKGTKERSSSPSRSGRKGTQRDPKPSHSHTHALASSLLSFSGCSVISGAPKGAGAQTLPFSTADSGPVAIWPGTVPSWGMIPLLLLGVHWSRLGGLWVVHTGACYQCSASVQPPLPKKHSRSPERIGMHFPPSPTSSLNRFLSLWGTLISS